MIRAEVKKYLQFADGAGMLDVSLTIKKGSFVVLAGASGAGKSTFLRLLAGLETPDGGRIANGEELWADVTGKKFVPARKRGIGYVFQNYALFPHMTVKENVSFGAVKGVNVDELLEATGLTGLSACKPTSLSGGQCQRVAIARALARKPELLLLDEPLSALDGGIRTSLQNELKRIHETFGVTVVMVSHDPHEMLKLADRIIAFASGRVVADGVPEEVVPQFLTEAGGVGEVVASGNGALVISGFDGMKVGDRVLLNRFGRKEGYPAHVVELKFRAQ